MKSDRPDAHAHARAVKYLETCDPAISGSGGHNKTFEVARAIVWGFDLGAESGYDLLASHYNPRCVPPWSEKDLRRKCAEADTRSYNKPRGYFLSEDRNGSNSSTPTPRTPTRSASEDPGETPIGDDSTSGTAGNDTVTSSSWPDIVPLSEVPEAEPFPLDVLPGRLQHVVREIAAALNVPPDFAAVPLLVLAGASIGMSRQLEIVEGHIQHPLLYVALIAPPGTKKSPALAIIRRPLDEIQREYHLEWKAKVKVHKADLAAYNTAIRGRDRDRPTPIEPERPILQRVVIGNATVESIAKILSENPRGIVSIRDELSGWVSEMNQYKNGHGCDRSVYLSINSCQPILVDRKGTHNEGPLSIDRPFVSIVGNMTPSSLPMVRGTEGDDGFMDRIVASYPASLPHRGATRQGVSESATATLDEVIRKLHTLEMIEETRKDSEEVVGWRPRTVYLTEDGWDAWKEFTDALADEMNGDDFPPAMRGPWAKLEGYCGRVALMLHYMHWACGDQAEADLDGNTMRDAARIVGYLKSHARKVYSLMDADPRVAVSRQLLKAIIRKRPADPREVYTFSARDAHRLLPGREQRASSEVQAPLDMLAAHGYIRKMPAVAHPGVGRKPSDQYEVNPSAFCPCVHSVHVP